MKKFHSLFFFLFFLLLLFPIIVLATEPIKLQIGLGSRTYVNDLADYIQALYLFFIPACGVLAAVMIFFGGYRWITAAGNATRISEAKETVLSAVFGLVLALTSYVLLNTINPNITALKSLVIPIVKTLTTPGGATRLCDFDGEKTLGLPTRCGMELKAEETDTNGSGDSCLGVAASDPDNYCLITETNLGGKTFFMGTDMNAVVVSNHPSGAGASLKTTNEYGCGTVVFETGQTALTPNNWKVGSLCLNAPGTSWSWGCVLRDKLASFNQQGVGAYTGINCTGQYATGCGKIIGMDCATLSDPFNY